MTYGLQIIGVLFGLVMLYLTFLYWKKRAYDGKSFAIWTLVWIFFLAMVAFPDTIYGVMEGLKIERTVDFFVIAGFLFFSVIIFYLYVITSKNKRKIEEIVRKIALKKAKPGSV